MRRAHPDDAEPGPPGGVLDRAVLVLNRSWTAIATTTVRHAMALVCTGTGRFVQPETWEVHEFDTWIELIVLNGDPCLHTPHRRIRVPEVLVLTRFNGIPVRSVSFSRRNLLRRDASTCQYCGERPCHSDLTIDHIVPRSRGGRSTWANCVIACRNCNRRKGDMRPEDAGLRLDRLPSEPRWTPVFGLPTRRATHVWRRFVSDRQWSEVPRR